MNQTIGGALAGLMGQPESGPEPQRVPVMIIEALPGGFVLTTQTQQNCRRAERRELVPNADALVSAINRWCATEVRGMTPGQS